VARWLGTSLGTLCLAVGLASACGGGEFSSGDEGDAGEGAGGGEPQSGSTSGGKTAAGGTSSKGGGASGGKAGEGNTSGAGSSSAGAGGAGGITSGGSGGFASGGTAGGGTAGGGTAGAGGSPGPCANKQDAECVTCCGALVPLAAYENRSYTCACSEPCYAGCTPFCDLGQGRSLECQRCTIDRLGPDASNLCLSDYALCEDEPACKAASDCLRTCL
jgi:hypothetical protein